MDERQKAGSIRLLGTSRDEAFDDGEAPLLRLAFSAPVTALLTAERTDAYLTLLYGMLIMRRSHELEPLHEDLYRRVIRAQNARDPGYTPESFAQDLAQLADWGALERTAETLRIRGYRDNRRERFRYRLSEDAVALLEWLEARLQARLQGRLRDSRDRLTDVLGHLRETLRLLDEWRRGEHGSERARRAIYLLSALDDAVHDISAELLDFRGGMLGFAARPYDPVALREVLDWLERYVSVYLARVEELRTDILGRVEVLAQPRYRRALAECREALAAELALTPRELRSSAPLRSTDELIDVQAPFFAAAGGLAQLCQRIDDSARAVLRKMHRHLRDLERRSARLLDLRARLAEVAALEAEPDARLAAFTRALVGSAHLRLDRRTPLADARALPPLPRTHKASPAEATSRPLRPKSLAAEEARALRAKREAELRGWLEAHVLHGRDRVALSRAELAGPEAPRRWLDVVRAQLLGGGRGLPRLGVSIQAREGTARLGGPEVGVEAPDCEIVARRQP